ncbi:MAG: dTMP kinase [Chlamydiales bacterium]|nr:dTMP kinase [Chlamydiales bacterium]
MSGYFITFEGGEGAGKTTLINRLFSALSDQGYSVIKTREPGGSLLGREIRTILLDKTEMFLSPRAELLLFLADRANHVDEVIKPALKQKKIVLCDRFTDSSFAYQGVHADISQETLNTLTSFAANQLVPHLTIYLDIDPEVAIERAKRLSFDRMEQRDIDFHHAVRKNFLELAGLFPERIFTIDATQTPEKVFELAYQKMQEKMHVKAR